MPGIFEKKPMESKKMLAFLWSDLSWKILLGGLIYFHGDVSVQLAVVAVAGFIEIGFILGQASLDKAVRLAQIALERDKPTLVLPPAPAPVAPAPEAPKPADPVVPAA